MSPRLYSMSLFRAMMIVAAFCLPALAQETAKEPAKEQKPILSVKTRAIEATLAIEDTLKAYPALYENLFAEGKRELDKWRASAESDRKTSPEEFKDGRRYAFDRSYTRRSAIGRYVSIERFDYLNSGGAHPNSLLDTILWDANAKKRISIRPLFKESAPGGPTLTRLAKEIRAALAVEKKARGADDIDPETDTELANVKPDLTKMGAVALVPSTEAGKSAGLEFNFSPYAVGPYAEGPYTVVVPWTTFKNDLSPEGAALFGGERPKSDEDKG
jgi:hypothetical protein